MSIIDSVLNTQMFFEGRVIDNNDPMMLGRLRVKPESDNDEELTKSAKGFNPNSITPDVDGPWSSKDPYLFLPLLPVFINPIPKVGEYVHLFYQFRGTRTTKNKFYVQGPFSTPLNLNLESLDNSKTFLDSGVRQTRPDNIKVNLSTEAAQRLEEAKTGLGYNDNKVNLGYKNDKTKGVFPEPGDNSLLGRGTSDVVLKENEVLIRAGKYKPVRPNSQPDANGNRAFLQLSKYDFTKQIGEKKNRKRLVKSDTFLNYLIEYNIYNPENTQNKFRGDITLYKLPSDVPEINTANFDVDTVLSSNLSVPTVKKLFENQSSDSVIKLINDFIKDFKSGQLKEQDVKTGELTDVFGSNGTLRNGEQFPFYFRPTKSLVNITSNTNLNSDSNALKNVGEILNKVKVNQLDITPGYSLVFNEKGDDTVPYEFVDDSYNEETINNVDETVALMGGKKLFLLSNQVSGTGSGKKVIDFSDYDVYGISQDKIFKEIEPNTSSMVRGEELIELLNLIVKYLITHVHPYPGLPPVPVSQDGTSSQDILKSILEAQQKILNGNIRIN